MEMTIGNPEILRMATECVTRMGRAAAHRKDLHDAYDLAFDEADREPCIGPVARRGLEPFRRAADEADTALVQTAIAECGYFWPMLENHGLLNHPYGRELQTQMNAHLGELPETAVYQR